MSSRSTPSIRRWPSPATPLESICRISAAPAWASAAVAIRRLLMVSIEISGQGAAHNRKAGVHSPFPRPARRDAVTLGYEPQRFRCRRLQALVHRGRQWNRRSLHAPPQHGASPPPVDRGPDAVADNAVRFGLAVGGRRLTASTSDLADDRILYGTTEFLIRLPMIRWF